MNSKFMSISRILPACAFALVTMGSTAFAETIISGTFTSAGDRQPFDGTQAGLSVDVPGGNWMWGAGWDWGAPYISANWDPPGVALNVANLAEEKTALGISIASAGSYIKPVQFTISSNITTQASPGGGGGLGFWSASTNLVQDNGGTSLTGFTGLLMKPNGASDGTLSLIENGTIVGTPFDVGFALSDGTFYNLSYTVNTTDGSISNIFFNGDAVTGITSGAFTNTATTYAGLMSNSSGRLEALDFNVVTAIPEPGSYAMVLFGFATLFGFRQIRRRVLKA